MNTIRTWKERVAHLDKPTDFAERCAAIAEASELRRELERLTAMRPDEHAALLADHLELNPVNYGPDDVAALNAWAIRAYDFINRATEPDDGEPLTCDFCGAQTDDPWHTSDTTRKHLHQCDECHTGTILAFRQVGHVVVAEQTGIPRIHLFDYAATRASQVASKVMDVAYREGYRGTAGDRLKELGWRIVPVYVHTA